MRVIKVNDDSRSERWILWLVAGAAIGVTAGVLAAGQFGGGKPTAKGLLRRARSLVRGAREQWGPMLALAMELQEVVGNRAPRDPDADPMDLEDEDDLDESDLDDAEDFDTDEVEAYDDAETDDGDEDDEDDDLDDPDLDSVAAPLIGRRVLEAFEHDPILAERNVEIDADDDTGVVTLFGSVRTPKEVAHAVTLARGVPGVTRVRQRIDVVRRRR